MEKSVKFPARHDFRSLNSTAIDRDCGRGISSQRPATPSASPNLPREVHACNHCLRKIEHKFLTRVSVVWSESGKGGGPFSSDPAGEAVDVDDPAAVESFGDEFEAVVGVHLEGDDRSVDQDHAPSAGDGEPFGNRGEVFDFEECADAPLVLVEAGGEGVAAGVFKVGDQPGRREDGGHPVVGEDDRLKAGVA